VESSVVAAGTRPMIVDGTAMKKPMMRRGNGGASAQNYNPKRVSPRNQQHSRGPAAGGGVTKTRQGRGRALA
jgi:hypothetical protein